MLRSGASSSTAFRPILCAICETGRLFATLTYSFARIGAALKKKVEDLQPKGSSCRLRLHEKGGKYHEMPCPHSLAQALPTYIATAGIC
jgi:integrase